jgi:uncharacterized membrane protein YeaQ/YmgE (transglycosylase-associated protein family)
MNNLLDPMVIGTWIVVGLVAGTIGKKLFYRRSGGGTFGSFLTTIINGMVGSAVGIVGGVLLNVPGANEVGWVMMLLAVAGTLVVMFIASRFSS